MNAIVNILAAIIAASWLVVIWAVIVGVLFAPLIGLIWLAVHVL